MEAAQPAKPNQSDTGNPYSLETEDKKYSQLYKRGYNYGPVDRTLAFFWPRYTKQRPAVLDCGCGRGRISERVKHSSYVGVDISSYQVEKNTRELGNKTTHFIHGPITGLHDYQIGHVDVAFSVDVLEHIPEEYAQDAVRVMCEKSETQIFSISCIPSFNTAEDGSNLHLNVKSPDWWLELIKKFTTVREMVRRDASLTLFCGDNYMAPESYDLPKGVRVHPDGSFYLPRKNKRIEDAMDAQFVRLPNERHWYPDSGENLPYEEFSSKFKDKVIGLVGKGPSLDHLNKDHFKGCDLVITFNESIKVIKDLNLDCEIIACQIDADLGRKSLYEAGKMLVSMQCKHHYGDKKDKYVFNDRHYSPAGPSGAVLVALCKKYGAMSATLFAHDACMGGSTDYAPGINERQRKPVERYSNHRQRIEKAADGLPLYWEEVVSPAKAEAIPSKATQTNPCSPEPCTPQQSDDNPQEHHASVTQSVQLQASDTANLGQSSRTEVPQHESQPDHSDTPQSPSCPEDESEK